MLSPCCQNLVAVQGSGFFGDACSKEVLRERVQVGDSGKILNSAHYSR